MANWALTAQLLTDLGAARSYLETSAGWSTELSARIDDGLASAIAVARETGLEGFALPVTLQVTRPTLLGEPITSSDAQWSSYISELEAETHKNLAVTINAIATKSLRIRNILRFTTSVTFNVTEQDLIEILSKVADPKSLAWLNSAGELELDAARHAIHLDDADFGLGADGAGQVVAVLDGEIDTLYPGLVGRVVQKGNFSDTAWGGTGLADSLGKEHGTKVAAILAGDGSEAPNGRSLKGVAPRATIWNYKIAPLVADGSSVAAALEQACIDGAKIANLSWGQSKAKPDGQSIWAQTVDAAFTKGMLTFKSVGNTGPEPGTLTSPADAAHVISVGSTDRLGTQVHEKSSRGPTVGGTNKPDLVAPGGGIQVTDRNGQIEAVAIPGTSFAAPIVAGVAALALQRNPNWSVAELRTAVLESCIRLQDVAIDEQGAGIIDARKLAGSGV